jgi:hypothetical protein
VTETLGAFVERALAASIVPAVAALAGQLGAEADARSVLFYGSNLRSGALEGVLDFYVLTPGPVERGMWPTVSYREVEIDGITLRAKIATMRLATFAQAAAARTLDTTIWARFAQPAALAWVADEAAARLTRDAVAAAGVSAARFAAALGPEEGAAVDYWRALFRATYAAELRVERSGREEQFIARDHDHYRALLPLAWMAAGISFTANGDRYRPQLAPDSRARLLRQWRRRRAMGKPINIARLIRAAFTFDGAARYGAWKIERHTGVAVRLTPWRERHPVLAAPGVLFAVWRARRG